ncbi:hypothetical protein MES4922_10078 [Mesorhizobium ventifaucium]|uniref:Uncharacterized protein n=1 Tax=Mesorhizobium ventifaucium TaxID=666020 RepID=A0ABM9DD36_9HYPH|nr:hypothetical protein MES4922_10078 [Mesorhizobium ventifaucium]
MRCCGAAAYLINSSYCCSMRLRRSPVSGSAEGSGARAPFRCRAPRTSSARERATVPATVANHLVAHRDDPNLLWYGELESTCAPCHDARIQKEEVRGYAIGCDESGRRIASDQSVESAALINVCDV